GTVKTGENKPKDFRVAEGMLGNALDRAELPGYQRFSCPSVRASYIRQTSSNTRLTSIRCIQTLSLQVEVRPFSALTHGLQAMPAQNTWLRAVRAAKRRGFSGPNNVTTSIGVSAAKCAGPLSFVTKTSANPHITTHCTAVART